MLERTEFSKVFVDNVMTTRLTDLYMCNFSAPYTSSFCGLAGIFPASSLGLSEDVILFLVLSLIISRVISFKVTSLARSRTQDAGGVNDIHKIVQMHMYQ